MTQQIKIRKPDDWHLHLRDGAMLKGVLPLTSKHYRRAIIMPNLVPPVKTTEDAQSYRQRIMDAIPAGDNFTPLMTCYLSDDTSPQDLVTGFKQGLFKAAKLYPAHATTNSAHGVTSIEAILPVLDAMQKEGMPLLIHGEVTAADVDVFDREARFIETILRPLVAKMPGLKIVLEHVTTSEAAEFVVNGSDNIAATVTPQHLLCDRNALFKGGIRPHYYCLPILKREKHREALAKIVTSGHKRFFLGTDSAPHECARKESACGCAGVFNASVAIQAYTTLFDQHNALAHLEAFCSLNGPHFYGLPVNEEFMTLERRPYLIPDSIPIEGEGKLVPFMAGETLPWTIVE
jgi:dihydroorotase